MSKLRITFSDLQADVVLMNERLASVGSEMRIVANKGNHTRYLTTENINSQAYVKSAVLCTGTAKECVEQGWHWVMMHVYDFVTDENRRLLTQISNLQFLNSTLSTDYLLALRTIDRVKEDCKQVQETLDSLREMNAWEAKYLSDPDADSVDY